MRCCSRSRVAGSAAVAVSRSLFRVKTNSLGELLEGCVPRRLCLKGLPYCHTRVLFCHVCVVVFLGWPCFPVFLQQHHGAFVAWGFRGPCPRARKPHAAPPRRSGHPTALPLHYAARAGTGTGAAAATAAGRLQEVRKSVRGATRTLSRVPFLRRLP